MAFLYVFFKLSSNLKGVLFPTPLPLSLSYTYAVLCYTRLLIADSVRIFCTYP